MENLTYEACVQILKDKKYTNVYDFDNHLDDLKYDWRNLNLCNVISSLPRSVDTLRSKND